MKKTVTIVLAAFLAVSMAFPALADTYVSSGNGGTVYYDDGSWVEYNARGSSVSIYDRYGNLVDEVYAQYTEQEFKRLYYGSSSSKKSSSKSSKNEKYASATINDAYWSYGSGNLTARWEADYRGSANYTLQLYCDGRKITSKTSSGGSSVNFTDSITNSGRIGDYYFIVKAKWPGSYTDEMESNGFYVDESRMNEMRRRGSSSGTGTAGGPGPGPGQSAGPGQAVGWQNYGSYWKYVKQDGNFAANGWEFINGKWYYFDGNGVMAANQWILSAVNPHIWYYVGPNGDMLTNQYIGQWYVNENGECFY